MDQSHVIDGPSAFELFAEGLYSQLSTFDRYDFEPCLQKFYTDELDQLSNYLKQIDSDYETDTQESMTNLVKVNMKGINDLFLAVNDKGCHSIIQQDAVDLVKQMNKLIDESSIEHVK